MDFHELFWSRKPWDVNNRLDTWGDFYPDPDPEFVSLCLTLVAQY